MRWNQLGCDTKELPALALSIQAVQLVHGARILSGLPKPVPFCYIRFEHPAVLKSRL